MAMPTLKNKVVVITGASRGLGKGMAAEMFTRGIKLGLCARTLPEATGSEDTLAAAIDVTDEVALGDFAQQVSERLGPIDMWINNAGVLEPIDQLRNVKTRDFRRHLDINITGVFHGSKIYANHVRERDGGGVLINISSGAARSAYSGWGAYCAGKAAVDRLTEVMAIEEEDAGLVAYAVAPGIIDTDMQELIRGVTADRFPLVERFRQLKADDAFTTADKVAAAILDLAFDPAAARDRVSIDLRE